MEMDINASLEFARTAALPEFEFLGLEAEDGVEPPNFDKPELAVTVGSQIASFAQGVDPALREQIANGFLFAQQAANKQIDDPALASSKEWYQTYVDVLTKIGWTSEDDGTLERVIKGTALEVHKEIIPILTLALGPAASGAALILKVLEGLNKMNDNAPWIKLFSHESQRAKANQFQLSHVESVDGAPRITLVNFELAAERSVTQVLFFKLDKSSAELRHTQRKISINEPIFSQVAPIIAERLAERAQKFVLEIDI